MTGSQWLCVNSCPPTQAPPYPMGVGFFSHSTCQPIPNPSPKPSPTIPHDLMTRCKVSKRVHVSNLEWAFISTSCSA
ncbi:hypothetical protein Hanom_Chr08g00744801 [Helianthus anomalus]